MPRRASASDSEENVGLPELAYDVNGLLGQDLVLGHQRPVHVGQQHADEGRSHATFFQDRRTVG